MPLEIVSFTFTPYQLAYHTSIHYHHSVALSLNTNSFHKSFYFLPYHRIHLQMFCRCTCFDTLTKCPDGRVMPCQKYTRVLILAVTTAMGSKC